MKPFIILMLFIATSSCSSPNKIEYSFFAAGHAYGDPMDNESSKGIYKPFKDKFQFINENKKIELGFLLGDVVRTPGYWDITEEDLSQLNATIYIARGNHDGALEQFEKRFGKSYKSFFKNQDLFIILDPNIDNWNISGEQLIFLKNVIRNKAKKAKNIFILMHQIIWWTPNEYSKPFPNSTYGRADSVNFWNQIEPLLVKSNKPVFVFGGDLGAFSSEQRNKNYPVEYSYFNKNNVTYIGTGMGGGSKDNFVIVDVFANGQVDFRLIHLNGDDINGLGKLEDYSTIN